MHPDPTKKNQTTGHFGEKPDPKFIFKTFFKTDSKEYLKSIILKLELKKNTQITKTNTQKQFVERIN